MVRLKRLAAWSGLTGVLAAASFAAPAGATVKTLCTVSGDVKMVDKENPDVGKRIVEGEGKFTFDSLTWLCVGDLNKDGIPEVFFADVSATGWYDNTICGTAKALGTIDDVRNAPLKFRAVLEGKKFALQITTAQAVFKWHDPTAKPIPLPKDTPDSEDKDIGDEKDYELGGYLSVGPPSGKFLEFPDLANGECTKAVSLTGEILVHFDS